MRLALCLASVLLVCACAAPAGEGEGELEDVESAEEAATAGPPTVLADVSGTSAFRVRAGGLTAWVDPLAVTKRAEGLVATVRFRTSRSLASAADRGVGEARLVSPRVVEVDLRGEDLSTTLGGEPLIVRLRAASGADRDYDVRLDLAPRFARFVGSTSVLVDRDIARVYWRDPRVSSLRYRYDIRATGAQAMGVYIGGQPSVLLTPLGIATGRFQANWSHERFERGIGLANAVEHTGTFRGARLTKTAEIDLAVTRVGLTKQGAEIAWPAQGCKPAVAACIASKAPAEKDLGSCGAYLDVRRCVDAD
ncbi:MAG: hypothetical protein KF819_21940 [Labilithrix sp.]|nr:hypothetical protein [Labilithrix sp.]